MANGGVCVQPRLASRVLCSEHREQVIVRESKCVCVCRCKSCRILQVEVHVHKHSVTSMQLCSSSYSTVLAIVVVEPNRTKDARSVLRCAALRYTRTRNQFQPCLTFNMVVHMPSSFQAGTQGCVFFYSFSLPRYTSTFLAQPCVDCWCYLTYLTYLTACYLLPNIYFVFRLVSNWTGTVSIAIHVRCFALCWLLAVAVALALASVLAHKKYTYNIC